MFSFSHFGFDKSFYDVIKQCFTTFSDAPPLRSIVSSMTHTEAYELQFHRGSIIFPLCVCLSVALSLSAFSFRRRRFFSDGVAVDVVVIIIISAKRTQNNPANARATLFSTNVHWSRQCVMCRCEVRRMPDYSFRYPAEGKKKFILRQNDAQKRTPIAKEGALQAPQIPSKAVDGDDGTLGKFHFEGILSGGNNFGSFFFEEKFPNSVLKVSSLSFWSKVNFHFRLSIPLEIQKTFQPITLYDWTLLSTPKLCLITFQQFEYNTEPEYIFPYIKTKIYFNSSCLTIPTEWDFYFLIWSNQNSLQKLVTTKMREIFVP